MPVKLICNTGGGVGKNNFYPNELYMSQIYKALRTVCLAHKYSKYYLSASRYCYYCY